MFSGFSAKTRTSVNGLPHADPAVRARTVTHPARASVQRSLAEQVVGLETFRDYIKFFRGNLNLMGKLLFN